MLFERELEDIFLKIFVQIMPERGVLSDYCSYILTS